ncbi:MAG: serine hydrolase [Pirellulaceae bacterium]
MMRRSMPYLVFLMAVAGFSEHGSAEEATGIVEQVEQLFADIDAKDPGCAVGIRLNGRTIVNRGFGLASVAYDWPNRSDTVFEIASGSKTFTSVCIALLLDQGKLSPDDDIRKLVPELSLESTVTIRHLLRCESGVWAQFHIMPLAGYDNVPVHSPYSKDDVLTVLSGQKELPFQPGTQFQYGSGDSFLLGVVVERVTGMSLAEFAKKSLFEPLGMTRTWYVDNPSVLVSNRAVGHWKNPASGDAGPDDVDPAWSEWNANAFLGGGGSVLTCVDDLLRWPQVYQQQLPRGRYIDEFARNGTVLGNRFVLDLDAFSKKLNDHPGNPPAGTYRGRRRFQITGGYWGFSCCASHFPDDHADIVCLSNSDSVFAPTMARKISDIVLASVLEPLDNQTDNRQDPNAMPSLPLLSPEQLRPFEGFYRRPGNYPVMHVEVHDDHLLLTNSYGDKTTLSPIGVGRFRPDGQSAFYPSAVFEFNRPDENRQASNFVLTSFENQIHEAYQHDRIMEPPTYTAELLQGFSGTYLSDEVGVVYHMRVRDGGLEMRVGGRRWERLEPLAADEFWPIVENRHNSRYIRFSRDEHAVVDGFSIGFWRIKGVKFRKLP